MIKNTHFSRNGPITCRISEDPLLFSSADKRNKKYKSERVVSKEVSR